MKIKINRGFTLIELVVVIVILGILAVTAAPKFLNLQKDARISTLKATKGALETAIQLVKAKAEINLIAPENCKNFNGTNNDDKIAGCININGHEVLVYSNTYYPDLVFGNNPSKNDKVVNNLKSILSIDAYPRKSQTYQKDMSPTGAGFLVYGSLDHDVYIMPNVKDAYKNILNCRVQYNGTQENSITLITKGC
ncbi:prepilin-type N-terminal cleavage/methylation domain-containing protein [Photobacterium damselae]|uniref:Type II secretion system protein n=1 Tax=Photobacterium damselae TaxID=38293 RepID=A0ABD6X6B0_PHODM|nr:type II secretion system protein [Photobacterium damselae]PSU18564.1 type II secretion system protein [Photobacterium damselae]